MDQRFGGYIEKAKAYRLDRFLEDQRTGHFWSMPLNKIKETVSIKRADYPLKKARERFSAIIDSQNELSSVEAVYQSINLLDCVYNHPVEAVMAGNDIYVKVHDEISR